MNILVCVKQVPDTTEIKIDPVKKTLIREGVPSIVNPYDTYALENAARMRDKDPSVKIYVLSMGPEQAKNALRECLAIAAYKAFLITDRAFGGSDTLATSYIISEAIRYVEKQEGIRFDAIFCGKQAIDGDTAQVGPEIAEQQGPEKKEIIGVSLPAVVTFTQGEHHVRYQNLRRRLAANRTEIDNITTVELSDIDLTRCGLKGSPTRVKSTFVPVHESNIQWIREETPEKSGVQLAHLLSDANII